MAPLNEPTLSRVQSEHFLPGCFAAHWHGGDATEPYEKGAIARNLTMSFPRYSRPVTARSWLGVLMARYLLAKLRYDGSGIQLADFASKRVPECLGRFHKLSEFDAFLWTE